MGQYFKAHIVKAGVPLVLSPYDYENGGKLMEHSWCGNLFTNAVYTLIENNPCEVAWVGDYSCDVNCPEDLYSDCWEKEIPGTEISVKEFTDPKGFLINHTKKEYVKLDDIKVNGNGWYIDPLPLLTAIGNGLGGGDYHGSNQDMVGRWAVDYIEYKKDRLPPYDCLTKVNGNFIEGLMEAL